MNSQHRYFPPVADQPIEDLQRHNEFESAGCHARAAIADAAARFHLADPPVTAHTILQDAANNIIQHAEQRDMLDGERSMARTVAAFNALTGNHLTEVDGCLFMVLLKAAHATVGKHHAEDYTDGSSYFALAGEAAHEAERTRGVAA